MKYKVGDKTLLGEIVEVYPERYMYVIRLKEGMFSSEITMAENWIDKIICKPKRNIDHIEELWFSGEKCEASIFWTDLLKKRMSMIKTLFEPYEEPRKYPVLTPEELKAVRWLTDGGYETIVREHGESYGCYGSLRGRVKVDVKINPISKILRNSAWITETPIDLKELLETQEGV